MKKSIERDIERKLEKALKDYDNATTHEEKMKCLAIIKQFESMSIAIDKKNSEIERNIQQTKNEESRKELEIAKFEFEKELSIRKFEEEKRKNSDENNDALLRRVHEEEYRKKQLLLTCLSTCGTLTLTLIGKLGYFALAKNAQNHDYGEYIMESKYSKEQRDNLLNK